MKKISLLFCASLFTVNYLAQQNPTGSGNTTLPPSVPNSSFSWYRGGNFPGGAAGTNNIFGTMWNSPVYHYTTNKQRMVVNGDRVVGINGFNGQVTDGLLV